MKGKAKKASILLLAVVLAFIAVLLGLRAWLYTGALGYEPRERVEMELYTNAVTKRAFVGQCVWDGTDGAELVIPDEVDGCRVTALGGYYGRGVTVPFCVRAPEEWSTQFNRFAIGGGAPDEAEEDDPNAAVSDCVLYLLLGKNLEEINCVALGSYASADGQRALRLRWHVTCDEANKTFYSENGRLYYRATGEAVESFHYWDAK